MILICIKLFLKITMIHLLIINHLPEKIKVLKDIQKSILVKIMTIILVVLVTILMIPALKNGNLRNQENKI
jgi:hypothetical protein